MPHPAIDRKFEERLKLFLQDSTDPILKDHQLTGQKKSYRAFSITGDIRVIYKIDEDIVLLYDIGTHNQIY